MNKNTNFQEHKIITQRGESTIIVGNVISCRTTSLEQVMSVPLSDRIKIIDLPEMVG
jgi:hypothetical protein